MHRACRWLIISALVCTVAGCDRAPVRDGAAAPTTTAPQELGEVVVRLRPPDRSEVVRLRVEDAHGPETRRIGLMHRPQLPPRSGMLFRFPSDDSGGFWMKNTLVPLSIAFFDAEGLILATLDMEPCGSGPCPSHDPGVPYRGALEVNQGLFDRIGVERGWTVELPDGLPPAS